MSKFRTIWKHTDLVSYQYTHADPLINTLQTVERSWSKINKYVNGINRIITEMYEH